VAFLLIVGTMSVVAQEQRPRAGGEEKSDILMNGWDHFSVDVWIRRQRLDGSGKPSGPKEPDVAYRWERQQKGSGWNTTMTILSSEAPVVQSIEGPRELKGSDRAVARIEDDEDGTPLRFYDARGRRLEVPGFDALAKHGEFGAAVTRGRETLESLTPMPRPSSASRDWIEGLVVPKAKKDARRKSVEGKYGRARGQVRGLDQFLTAGPDGQQELLVDRTSHVPVEINLMKDGALVSQTRIAYEPGPDESLIRRSVRIEQVAPDRKDGNEGRTVSEIQFTNLRLAKKGGAR
jgi:hypothetical protein